MHPRIAWLVRAVVALVIILSNVAGTAPVARADECKPEGIPVRAGTGLPGSIDGQVDRSTGTKYGDYGWSNLRWYTCDLGDGGLGDHLPDAAKDPNAVMNTSTGNGGMGFAVVLAALSTQLHEWVANPGAFLNPIDSRVDPITKAVTAAIWTPYGGAVIALAALFIGSWAWNSGNARRIGRTVAAIFIALLGIAWFAAPMTLRVPTDTLDVKTGQPIMQVQRVTGAEYAASMFDGVAVSIVGTVDRSIIDGGKGQQSDEEARGAVLNDRLLYAFWAEGATGCKTFVAPQSPACRAAGKLFEAQSVKWGDTADQEARRNGYKAAAEALKKEDPAAYQTLRGKDGTRAGYGVFAALYMILIAAVRIPAELMILIGLLLIRFVVMLSPLFLMAAIVESTRPIAHMAWKMVLASIYNVAVFGVIAAIHTAIIVALLGTNLVVSFVLVLALTIVIWIITKPFRSFVRPATGEAVAQQMQSVESMPGRAISGAKSMLGSAIGSYVGSRTGTSQATKKKDAGKAKQSESATPDTFTRDEDQAALPYVRVHQLPAREPVKALHGEPPTDAHMVPASPAPRPLNGEGAHLALDPPAPPTSLGVTRSQPALPPAAGVTRDVSIERQNEIAPGSQPEQVAAAPIRRELVAGELENIYVPGRHGEYSEPESASTVVIRGEVVDVIDEVTIRHSTQLVELDSDGQSPTELFNPRALTKTGGQ